MAAQLAVTLALRSTPSVEVVWALLLDRPSARLYAVSSCAKTGNASKSGFIIVIFPDCTPPFRVDIYTDALSDVQTAYGTAPTTASANTALSRGNLGSSCDFLHCL